MAESYFLLCDADEDLRGAAPRDDPAAGRLAGATGRFFTAVAARGFAPRTAVGFVLSLAPAARAAGALGRLPCSARAAGRRSDRGSAEDFDSALGAR
jgi:hypothetical protein